MIELKIEKNIITNSDEVVVKVNGFMVATINIHDVHREPNTEEVTMEIAVTSKFITKTEHTIGPEESFDGKKLQQVIIYL